MDHRIYQLSNRPSPFCTAFFCDWKPLTSALPKCISTTFENRQPTPPRTLLLHPAGSQSCCKLASVHKAYLISAISALHLNILKASENGMSHDSESSTSTMTAVETQKMSVLDVGIVHQRRGFWIQHLRTLGHPAIQQIRDVFVQDCHQVSNATGI